MTPSKQPIQSDQRWRLAAKYSPAHLCAAYVIYLITCCVCLQFYNCTEINDLNVQLRVWWIFFFSWPIIANSHAASANQRLSPKAMSTDLSVHVHACRDCLWKQSVHVIQLDLLHTYWVVFLAHRQMLHHLQRSRRVIAVCCFRGSNDEKKLHTKCSIHLFVCLFLPQNKSSQKVQMCNAHNVDSDTHVEKVNFL